ncbi:hypothetical protein [Streptomyces rubiginosohelvolus]|uniref:hypothetical protein n=1 Tax=Streptomyces rubiginosohelvolus TaxID=67362 RepID=UPI0033A6C192
MSVEIKFTGPVDPFHYQDGEGNEYRYEVNENGTLSIFEKERGGHIATKDQPIAVYGPAAWFSVTGDARTTKDKAPSQVRGLIG